MPRDDDLEWFGRIGAAMRRQSGRYCPQCGAPSSRTQLFCESCQKALPAPFRMKVLMTVGALGGAAILGLYWGFRPFSGMVGEAGGLAESFNWTGLGVGAFLGALGGMLVGVLFDLLAVGVVELFAGNWLARVWFGESRSHDEGWVFGAVAILFVFLGLGGVGAMAYGLFLADPGDEVRQFLPPVGNVQALAVSPDGKVILAAEGREQVSLRDVVTGKLIRTLKPFVTHAVGFSPLSSQEFVTGGSGSTDGTLRLWKVDSDKALLQFTGHSRPVTAVAFTRDGRRLLSGSADGTLRLWNVADGKDLRSLNHKQSVAALAISPDGRRAVSAGWAGLRLWDLETGTELRYVQRLSPVTAVAFTADGLGVLFAAQDQSVVLLEAETAKELRSWQGRGLALVLSPDGRRAASAVKDGASGMAVLLWDPDSGQELHRCGGYFNIGRLAFFPDGSHLVVSASEGGGEQTLRLQRLPK